MLRLVIKGNPKAQKRHRHTRKGFTYDPSANDKRDFLALIHSKAPKQPLQGGIQLIIKFAMPYPKKWYRTGKFAGILKDTAPHEHVITPDIDNLLKFVLDSGNKILWKDDSQIWKVEMEKVYGEENMTVIEVINEK